MASLYFVPNKLQLKSANETKYKQQQDRLKITQE